MEERATSPDIETDLKEFSPSPDDLLHLAPTGGTTGLPKLRITSYNVCYTKLLRYAVSIVFDEADTNGETDGADDEIMENRAKRSKDISLIFWPARTDQQLIRPIVITGVYEDNSTGLYYLMVPFAFAGDVVAVTVAVVVLAFLNCPTCFAAMNN